MDAAELELVRKAIMSGLGGCVEWDIKVSDRVQASLDCDGLVLEGVRSELIRFVRKGGDVTQVKETREEWKDRRAYWYKVILPMPKLFAKGLFVEIELTDPDPELPEVGLLNAHEQQ